MPIPVFVAILVGLACAAFSRIFGGDWPVFAVTWLAATATAMFVRQEMNHRHVNALLNVVLTAFVAGLIASSATLFQISPDPQIALAASVLLLVPGVQLVNASEDLLKGHTVTGIIRGINGGLISLGIALGIALVLSLPGVQGLWQGNITRQPQPVWLDALWSGVAALGFALLFNVPPRTLWAWCCAEPPVMPCQPLHQPQRANHRKPGDCHLHLCLSRRVYGGIAGATTTSPLYAHLHHLRGHPDGSGHICLWGDD